MEMERRKAQDCFPVFMGGKGLLFYGQKQEKRERKILFPIVAEFLFPQLIDLNTPTQVNAQQTVLLGGRGLPFSKTIILLQWFPHQGQPLLLGWQAICLLSPEAGLTTVLVFIHPRPIYTPYTAAFQPEASMDMHQYKSSVSLTKGHTVPRVGTTFPILSPILKYVQAHCLIYTDIVSDIPLI